MRIGPDLSAPPCPRARARAPYSAVESGMKRRPPLSLSPSRLSRYLPVRHYEYIESIVPRDVGLRLVQVREAREGEPQLHPRS